MRKLTIQISNKTVMAVKGLTEPEEVSESGFIVYNVGIITREMAQHLYDAHTVNESAPLILLVDGEEILSSKSLWYHEIAVEINDNDERFWKKIDLDCKEA